MEKQILEVVLNMQANQLEMQKDIKDLKDGQKNLEKDVKDLKEGQKVLEDKYAGLQADVKDLKEGQKRLELLRRQDSINIARILEVQVEQLRDIG